MNNLPKQMYNVKKNIYKLSMTDWIKQAKVDITIYIYMDQSLQSRRGACNKFAVITCDAQQSILKLYYLLYVRLLLYRTNIVILLHLCDAGCIEFRMRLLFVFSRQLFCTINLGCISSGRCCCNYIYIYRMRRIAFHVLQLEAMTVKYILICDVYIEVYLSITQYTDFIAVYI